MLLLALLALWIALALVFNGEPEVDRWISSMFFAAQPCAQGSQAIACGGFPGRRKRSLEAIRSFFHYLPVVVAVVVVAILARDLAAGRVSPTDAFVSRSRRLRPCSSVPA